MTPILDAPLFWAVQVVAVIVGFVALPAIAGLLAPSLPRGVRTIMGRILWSMASLINGPYVIRWPENDGWPDIYPADRDRDAALVDGEWREFDPNGNWSKLGMQPFGITYAKSEDAFGDVLADQSRADGGTNSRGDKPVVGHASGDGYVIDIFKFVNRWSAAASTRLNSKGKDEAMKEHGGDTAEMTNKQIIIGVLVSMLLAGVFGIVSFGGVL